MPVLRKSYSGMKMSGASCARSKQLSGRQPVSDEMRPGGKSYLSSDCWSATCVSVLISPFFYSVVLASLFRRVCHLQQVETAQYLAAQAHREANTRLERSEAQATALAAMDAEQARRITYAVEAACAEALARKSARTTAEKAAEAERDRRIAEAQATAADEANMRVAARATATQAAEDERHQQMTVMLTEARALAQERAAEGMRARALEDGERERRVGAAASAAARDALEREANR